MIILITGASHTGKTALAQKLLEKYNYPYLSIDHLKMGLIRSGNTKLTPMSDDGDLTAYLWPIVCEIIKTAIENKQHLIVEGCYIPFDWEKDFTKEYLNEIKYVCLVMSENYIRNHFDDIKKYANIIENRLDDDCTLAGVIEDNARILESAEMYNANYVFIDDEYKIDIDLERNFKTMEKDYGEYITFNVTAKDGSEVELALVDEFDFEGKHYVVGALIKDETIQEDGLYIYRSIIEKDGFRVEKITREFEYKRVAEAYMEMEE